MFRPASSLTAASDVPAVVPMKATQAHAASPCARRSNTRVLIGGGVSRPPRSAGTPIAKKPASAICADTSGGIRRAASISSLRLEKASPSASAASSKSVSDMVPAPLKAGRAALHGHRVSAKRSGPIHRTFRLALPVLRTPAAQAEPCLHDTRNATPRLPRTSRQPAEESEPVEPCAQPGPDGCARLRSQRFRTRNPQCAMTPCRSSVMQPPIISGALCSPCTSSCQGCPRSQISPAPPSTCLCTACLS